MDLLVIAHPGEAGGFTGDPAVRPVPGEPGLRLHPDWLLFICGEAVEGAWPKLSAILVKHTGITRVVNLGCGGSLFPALEKGHIYPVSTVTAENKSESYTGADKKGYKTVTTVKGVFTAEERRVLANQAQIVDRELFHIARFCHDKELPWVSRKYISDNAGLDTDKGTVKSGAPAISEALKKCYNNEILGKNS